MLWVIIPSKSPGNFSTCAAAVRRHEPSAKIILIDDKGQAGANLDLFFKTLNGISNTDDCAEGFSPADEFRIVNIESGPGDPRKTYFDISLDNFHLVEQLGPYQLFQRF